MDDEDGKEDFSINDTDLEFAMNPSKYRRRQTKEQAALGIWADDSDDEADTSSRPSFGKKRPNYTTPLRFVSGGVAVGNKMDGNEDEKPGTSMKSEDEPIEINFKKAKKEVKKPQQQQMGAHVFAGMRTSSTKASTDPNNMDWIAQSGKGAALMNMMKKMNWSADKGLGKEGQGIVEPIIAQLRPGRGAVGAYGKEVNSSGPRFGESAADAQRRISGESINDKSQEKVASVVPKGAWKKNAKIKTVYKTIDDVIKEGAGPVRAFRGTGVSKVIDMTGPEQRVYSGYDAFSLKTKAEIEDPRDVFDVPELTQNINLLLDMTEEDIRRTNHQLGVLKDQTVALKHDYQRAKDEVDKAESDYDKIKAIYNLLANFAEKRSPTMNECQALFNRLRTEFPIEYQLLHLESAAIPIVLPLIANFFARWRPLNPDHSIYGIDLMKEWKEILKDSDAGMFPSSQAAILDKLPAFDRLLWDGWMPAVRRAVLEWDPRTQYAALIEMIQTWLPLLPNWMKENLLERVIVPKIEAEVEKWNPLKDPIPISKWIVPWLEIMGDRLVPVFSPIRQELAKALRLWHPVDPGALMMLRPWKGIWTQATMSAFCNMNIVPALERCLTNMILDPNQNKFPEFEAVLSWLELISDDLIVNVISRHFFPKWYSQIIEWLDSAPGDPTVLNEVMKWCMSWKERVPPGLLRKFPTLEADFKRAMIAIHTSSLGRRIGLGAPVQPILINAPPPPPPPSMQPPPIPKPTVQLTIRETLEKEAEHHGLTFVPQTNRLRDGNQVFWFGSQSIYITAGVIYNYDTKDFDWYPITISRLLQYNGIQ